MKRPEAILKGFNLIKRFQIKKGPASTGGTLVAVDNLDLELIRGETHGIAGESGCGKSTLGRVMAGLIQPDSGRIEFQGSPLSGMDKAGFSRFRQQTQMIFQDPFSSLNPRMRIGDIIAEPLRISGKAAGEELRSRTEELMQTVGISAEQYKRFPHEFSGGQRQRIGIARALSASPQIIIADEPVSALDISIQAQIINLLQNMKSAYNLSMIMISHDLSVLRHVCDRVSIMYLGTIVESAPAAQLFSDCRHPYTEALIASIPGIGKSRCKHGKLLKDDIPSPLALPAGCRFHPRCAYAAEICRQSAPPFELKSERHMAACHFSSKIFTGR